MPKSQRHYDASCYDVNCVADAKRVILTDEDSTTDERWSLETPYVAELVAEQLKLCARHRVLDYGCGIGRLAKPLIGLSGCRVVGIDISVRMRALAPCYVLNDRFLACAPEALDDDIGVFDCAIACWALQHIPDLEAAIQQIHRRLKPYGSLFVLNNLRRALPVGGGEWADDNKDVRTALRARFLEIAHGKPDPAHVAARVVQGSFWGMYQAQ